MSAFVSTTVLLSNTITVLLSNTIRINISMRHYREKSLSARVIIQVSKIVIESFNLFQSMAKEKGKIAQFLEQMKMHDLREAII